MVTGWAMSDGQLWGTQRSGVSLVVDSKGIVSIGKFGTLPLDARQVVGSEEQLVTAGKNTARTRDLAPRTAVGVDRAGKKLVMLVVDGRRPDYSVGMSGPQVADELIKLGCWDALTLDGGGSSTMVMPDPERPQRMKIMNRPSDGHDLPLDLSVERPVACAIGIAIKEDPTTKP
jgi:exopolysaccharide biosynthesis protein